MKYQRPGRLTQILSGSTAPEGDLAILELLRQLREQFGQRAAALADRSGHLVECNVDQRQLACDISDHVERVVMANAQHILGRAVPDLAGTTLYVMPGFEEALGQIWLFGPSRVVLLDERSESQAKIPIASDYWEQASTVRQMNFERMSLNRDAHRSDAAVERLSPQRSDFLLFPQAVWIADLLGDPNQVRTLDDIMRLLHQVALENVAQGGGPFAAAVIDHDGRIIELNVNVVVPQRDCGAHAEKTTMSNALRLLGRQTLAGYELVSSSAPCIGCAEQIVHFSPDRVYSCVPRESVESLSPFTEGPLPGDYWETVAERHGILHTSGFLYDELRAQGDAPFLAFQEAIQTNPSQSYLERSRTHEDG